MTNPCPYCSEPLILSKPFCPSCGRQTPEQGVVSTLTAYLGVKVDEELSRRVVSQEGLVRELADKIEDILFRRIRYYVILIGLAASLLAFFGYSKYADFAEKINPKIELIKQEVKAAKTSVDAETTQISKVQTSLAVLSSNVAAQMTQGKAQSKEIATKFSDLLTLASQTENKATSVSTRVDALSRKVNSDSDQLTQRVQQVTNQVDLATVQQAYPGLGKIGVLLLNGRTWSGNLGKRPGQKWVNISMIPPAQPDYTTQQISELEDSIKALGALPFLGIFTLSAPSYSQDYLLSSVQVPTVAFFDDSNEIFAGEIAQRADIIFHLKFSPKLIEISKLPSGYLTRMETIFVRQSGIDIEVVLPVTQ